MAWNGPHALTSINVNGLSEVSGSYVLGYAQGDKSVGAYVGRSDDNLSARLRAHLPENETNACIKDKGCDLFWYQYADGAKEAYEQECTEYHRVGNGYACNDIHPAKSGQSWKCPVCGA